MNYKFYQHPYQKQKHQSKFVKKLKLKIGNITVAENGRMSENYDEEKLKEYMKWDSVEIEVNLKLGNDAFKCYTCDFTHDYIDINANYRN